MPQRIGLRKTLRIGAKSLLAAAVVATVAGGIKCWVLVADYKQTWPNDTQGAWSLGLDEGGHTAAAWGLITLLVSFGGMYANARWKGEPADWQ